MEASICNNCVNNHNCTYQTGLSYDIKSTCESHEIKQNQSIPSQKIEITKSDIVKDLCSICDNKDNCALRNPEFYIFKCEHYI